MKLPMVIQSNLSTGAIRRLYREVNRGRMISVSGMRRSVTSSGTKLVARRSRQMAADSGTTSRWRLTATDTVGIVRVAEGSVLKGSWLEAEAATVTVSGGSSANPHYIYCEINLVSGAVSIASGAMASKPTSDATTIRIVLHSVYLSGSAVVHVAQHQASDIILDKVYA